MFSIAAAVGREIETHSRHILHGQGLYGCQTAERREHDELLLRRLSNGRDRPLLKEPSAQAEVEVLQRRGGIKAEELLQQTTEAEAETTWKSEDNLRVAGSRRS